MSDDYCIKISICRVIPAEMWRVVRIITRVQEFPGIVPSVRKVCVLSRSRNKIKTAWEVRVDKLSVSWVEDDEFLLKENVIKFKSLEGDWEEFEGSWQFKKHSQGTEVFLTARAKIDIPIVNNFAREYLERLLIKNFEAILVYLEKHLISIRYKDYLIRGTGKISGFGIIGHFYNFYHLEKSLKMLKPDLKMPSREFLSELFYLTPSFKIYDRKGFISRTGDSVDGCFILATFIPDMAEKDLWGVFSKVVRACKIAEKHGVGVVSLGGFTSIVAERMGSAITTQVDVPVTTGNTFTSAMVLEGVYKAADMLGINPDSAKAAIVGGTGDIGSACARVLTEKVARVTITGRTKSNLRRLKTELSKKRKAVIAATTDNKAAVKDADIVIAAAGVSSSILDISWFKPGSIVCDVGYPKNISYSPVPREDILVFSGGLSKIPTPLQFPIDTGLPVANITYGCFSEAIILALEKRFENYSFGRGNIVPEKIQEITELGKKHGFEVSDLWSGNKLITKQDVKKIKANHG